MTYLRMVINKIFLHREHLINNNIRINESIKASNLRVVSEDGQQLGVMSKSEALSLAGKAGVDLVEIAPNADPPVVKIIDWGKYQYQKTKELQKNKRSNKQSELKQMRFGLKIGSGDLEVKLKKIRAFLDNGHKVRIQIFFRGREMAHRELGFDMIEKIATMLEDVAVMEQKPQLSGRTLSVVIRRK